MFRRQKVLLYLISKLNELDCKITKTGLDKLLFILNKESGITNLVKFYNFYPHKYGPFSNQFAYDLADLQSKGLVDSNYKITPNVGELGNLLLTKEKAAIDPVIQKFGKSNVVDYVYAHYPEYTKRSLLKEQKPEPIDPGIYSIGYEGKDIDKFLDVLIQNNIQVLVDVRANPFSMNFSFVKSKLSNYLSKAQIEYLHVPELGIDGELRKKLETDSDYAELFQLYKKDILPNQLDKVAELKALGKKKRIALMCFEEDRCHCHRGVISELLEKEGITVTHL